MGELTFTQQPIQDQSPFDPTLTVQNQDDLLVLLFEKRSLDRRIRSPDIGSRVAEIALDDALDEVENNAQRAVMDTSYGSSEGQSEAIQVGLEPVVSALL